MLTYCVRPLSVARRFAVAVLATRLGQRRREVMVSEVHFMNDGDSLGGVDVSQTVDSLVNEFQKKEGTDLLKDRLSVLRLTEVVKKAEVELPGVQNVDSASRGGKRALIVS